MATTQQPKKPTTPQQAENPRPEDALVRADLWRRLGQPGSTCTIRVHWLWDRHFRANVLVGRDPLSCRIAHSYFITADDEGRILEATPRITCLPDLGARTDSGPATEDPQAARDRPSAS